MWQGREIVWCTLALLAGNLTGDALPLAPWVYLFLFCAFAVCACVRPRRAGLLLCFFLAGAAGVQVGRMGGPAGPSALAVRAADCQAAFSAWLGGLLPPGEDLAVLQALSVGDRQGLTRDLRAAWRASGAMHLLALSGLHVGLLYGLFRRLTAPLGGYRAARLVRSGLLLGLLWTYAVITGLSASIVRAVLMITFYEISGLMAEGRDSLSALSGSAFFLLLFRPESPRDIGFQLSYTAVLSILLLHPWLRTRLKTRSRLLTRVWEMLSVSLCCQATCGVLAWIYFGTFPRYFLLTTLLAIPLTTAVMYTLVAAVAAAGLSSFAARLLPAAVPLLSGLAALSKTAIAVLSGLIHLLNTLIRLIAEL